MFRQSYLALKKKKRTSTRFRSSTKSKIFSLCGTLRTDRVYRTISNVYVLKLIVHAKYYPTIRHKCDSLLHNYLLVVVRRGLIDIVKFVT